MNPDDIFLLAQLIDGLEENISDLEKAYSKKDKEDFDKYKKAILEFQSKINHLLK